MTIIQACILAVIEGITEFLPVSSTGHLVLAAQILGLAQTDFTASFEIIIQFGAILAILSLYGTSVKKNPRILLPLAASFIPTAVVGLGMYAVIKDVFLTDPMITVYTLAAGGIVLLFADRWKPVSPKTDIASMPIRHAVLLGIGQSLAIIPGVSRAGATIVTALLLGYSRKAAVEYSFLLAVPTIAAAAGLDAIRNAGVIAEHLPILTLGLIVSWLTAIVAVRGFVAYLKRHSLAAFGWYRIAVSGVYLLLTGI